MNRMDAYAELRRIGPPVISTDDARVRLRTSTTAASQLLRRLAGTGLVLDLRHGLWGLDPHFDPLALPLYLTRPLPAYISLFSALYHHDMIDQVPRVTYVVSMGRAHMVKTSLGTYSIRRVAPEVFGGYTIDEKSGVWLATPEKALFDMLYLSWSRDRQFARVVDVRLPRGFRAREVRRWIGMIPSARIRGIVTGRLSALLKDLEEERQWERTGSE
jgi:predicted transcriptional regulator of viral defense system